MSATKGAIVGVATTLKGSTTSAVRAAGRGAFRAYARGATWVRTPFGKSVAAGLAGIVVAAAFVALVHTSSASGMTASLSCSPGLQTDGSCQVGVNQQVTVTATVNGGDVITVDGTAVGYNLWYFFGTTNAQGALQFTSHNIPAPCNSNPCNTQVTDSATHSYMTPGSYDMSVTVYDAEGNYFILTQIINVVPATVSIQSDSVSATTANEGQPITFTAATSVSPSYYQNDLVDLSWSFGDGSIATATSVSPSVTHTFADSGTFIVELTATDSATGAASRNYTAVTINDPPPVAAITLPSSEIVEDSAATFSALGTTDVPTDMSKLTYLWNWGDGAESAGQQPDGSASHVYTESGPYTVTLSVKDEEDHVSTTSAQIIVQNPLPSAGINPLAALQVGDTAFLQASLYLDTPSDTPFLNYTWLASSGTAYGIEGRAGYFQPGPASANQVGLIVTDDEGQTPSCGASTPVCASAGVQVVDTQPSIGVYNMYARANITLYLAGTPGNAVNISLLKNGAVIASRVCLRVHQDPILDSVTFHDVTLTLGNSYGILASYLPSYLSSYPTGSNPGFLSLQFWGNTTGNTSLFHNFNFQQTQTWNWSLSANQLMDGEPIFIQSQGFSPAETPLTVSYNFGDGVTATSAGPSSPIPEPTLDTFLVQHLWRAGADYSLNLGVADAFGMSGSDVITISETGPLFVNDTAPLVMMSPPSSVVEETPATYVSTSTDAAASVGPFHEWWHFGDHSNQGGSSVTHIFRYGATTYAVVVYSSSAGGSHTANWTFVPVANPKPIPSFTPLTSSIEEGSPLFFDARSSQDAGGSTAGLTYGWNFGDGTPAGGQYGAGAQTNHIYDQEGTYTVTLTVTDEEGASASTSQLVTVTDVSLAVTLSPATATVDQFFSMTPQVALVSPEDLPMLTATWSWGDGTTSSGIAGSHTFLGTGHMTVSVTVSNEDQLVSATASATVTIVDQPLDVVLPYGGATVYGEHHQAPFVATALGSLTDNNHASGGYTFVWTLGDGSPSVQHLGVSNPDTLDASYTTSGNVILSVSTTSVFQGQGTASAKLTLVPNTDGNGIPDMYETLILHTIPGDDPQSGQGLTDFVKVFVLKGDPLNADSDRDGLTDFQEVFGTVTGYVSNPLDPSTSGDGLADGQHLFSSTYPAARIVPFSGYSNGQDGSATVPIPNATYGTPSISADPVAFNQSTLTVQLSSSDVGQVSLSLTDPNGGSTLQLGTPTKSTTTYYLLNSTPTGGIHDLYGTTSLSIFQEGFLSGTGHPWTLDVTDAGTSGGEVTEATMTMSYWTNPAVADPTHSGMLVGANLTVPVFDCSESPDAVLTTFDPAALTGNPYTQVFYYPWNETYYKLSHIQGVPYAPGTDASVANVNDVPGCPIAGTSQAGSTASYMGDAVFGIPAWDSNFVDPALTNGMKALGQSSYSMTAGYYLGTDGQFHSSDTALNGNPYGQDPITYPGPLNPTAVSTSNDGIPDSQAIDPVAPLALQVYLGTVTDSGGCYANSNEENDPPPQIVSMTLDSGSGQTSPPVIYTTTTYPSSGPTNNDCYGYGLGGDEGYTYDFYSTYDLPLSDTSSDSSFTLEVDMWPTNTVTTVGSSASDKVSGTIALGNTVQLDCSGTNVCGSATVIAISREPTILVNGSGEMTNLPGYGYRFSGEQSFYSFYLNLVSGTPSNPTSDDPFVPGINVIMIDRPTFVQSTLGEYLGSQPPGSGSVPPALQSCFSSSAQITDRGTGTSQVGIVASFSADNVDDSCAVALLDELFPVNANGSAEHNTDLMLSTVPLELLGLDDQVLAVSPFVQPQGTGSTGGPPQTDTGTFFAVFDWIASWVYNVVVGAILAGANFLANLPGELEAFGQAIEGAFNAAINALDSAVKLVAQLMSDLINALESLADQLLSVVFSPIINAFASYFSTLFAAFQILASDVVNHHDSSVQADVLAFWNAFLTPFLIALLAVSIGLVAVVAVIEGFSLGSSFLIGAIITVAASSLVYGGQALGIGGGILSAMGTMGFAVVHGIGDIFNGSLPGGGAIVNHAIPASFRPSDCAGLHAFDTFATAFGFLGDLLDSFGPGFVLFAGAVLSPATSRADVAAVGIDVLLGILSLSLDVASAQAANGGNVILSYEESFGSVVLGLIGLARDSIYPTPELEGLETLDTIMTLVDVASVVVAGGQLVADASSGC